MLDICNEVLRTPYQHNRPKLLPFWSIRRVTPVQWPLEPASLKILTSLLRNRVLTYLNNNQFIESHHQKGFMPGMTGTFEHIAEMCLIINHSTKQQRSVTITLTDLENVFREVHHSLIQSVLRYQHIPDEINCIVKLLYSDFRWSIIKNDFCTKCIAAEKGVLQGDSISPLIFNLIINNFIQYVKEEKSTNFRYRTFKGFFPCNWFHSVPVTSLEDEKQILFKST